MFSAVWFIAGAGAVAVVAALVLVAVVIGGSVDD